MKKNIKLNEQDLVRLVTKVAKRVIKESMDEETSNVMDSYTHFAILKSTNKIVFEWDYSDYDPQELRTFKNDYFSRDLKDNDINPKDCIILNRATCIRRGIDPMDNNNYQQFV